MYKIIICLILSTGIFAVSTQQKAKVKRKGVTPIQINNPPKPQYNLQQMSGKWQEIKRTAHGSNDSKPFIDSLQINLSRQTATIRDGIHLPVVGDVDFDAPSTVTIAGDIFQILALDKKRLVLDDGEDVHYLEKTSAFHFESFGKTSVQQEVFTNPITPNMNALSGKWVIYKREAAPGTSHDQKLIRYLDIQSLNTDNTFSGEVGYFDPSGSLSSKATIEYKNNELQIITDNFSWVVAVFKADGNELVFGNMSDLLYFSKKL